MSLDPKQADFAEPSQADVKSPISIWALTIGSVLTVMATVAGSYARFILHTTRLDQNHLSVAAVFPFVLITLVLARPLKLSRGELIVIFSMSLIGATMPTYFIGKMMAYIAVPHYGATPENQWAIYYGNLPAWAAVPSGQGLQWYYEGLPKGMSIPWEIWIAPLMSVWMKR